MDIFGNRWTFYWIQCQSLRDEHDLYEFNGEPELFGHVLDGPSAKHEFSVVVARKGDGNAVNSSMARFGSPGWAQVFRWLERGGSPVYDVSMCRLQPAVMAVLYREWVERAMVRRSPVGLGAGWPEVVT